MKDLIRKELNQIKNLEERVVLKEMLEGVLLSLYETNEEKYQSLEKRVMEELAYDENRYQIKTGLIETLYLDPSHHLLSPMIEEDGRESRPYLAKEVRQGIKEKGRFRIRKVFLECDFLQMKEIWKRFGVSQGTIQVGEETYDVEVRVEKNRDYPEQIKHLYGLFMKNGIPWKTVNAPYLSKIADVFLTDLPESIKEPESIVLVKLDLGEYQSKIRYDRVPVWNIKKLMLNSMGFPVPCEDHKNYEHIISIKEYGTEHAYLVEEKAGIQSVRQQEERLLITGEVQEVQKWNIYMIRNSTHKKIDYDTYPVMENLRKDGFIERFQKKCQQNIKTKAELKRFIDGFGLEEYLEYMDCRLVEKEEWEEWETYSLNEFIQDEIREKGYQKKLLLFFQPKQKESYLTRDLASFLVSEVQVLYPEYQCQGTLSCL